MRIRVITSFFMQLSIDVKGSLNIEQVPHGNCFIHSELVIENLRYSLFQIIQPCYKTAQKIMSCAIPSVNKWTWLRAICRWAGEELDLQNMWGAQCAKKGENSIIFNTKEEYAVQRSWTCGSLLGNSFSVFFRAELVFHSMDVLSEPRNMKHFQ